MSRQVLSTQAPDLQTAPALNAWVRLLRGHTATRRTLSVQLQLEHDLTVNDYEALLHLSRAQDGALKRVDLATALLLTPSGITRLLEGLEVAGLVEKRACESDARVSYAAITDAGRGKLEAASCSHIGSVRALFEERYTDDELETLAELLGRLPGAGGADGSECDAR